MRGAITGTDSRLRTPARQAVPSPAVTTSEVRTERRARPRRPTALVWTVLWLAPVLYVIELTGPRWLNLVLRGTWVALVVLVGAALLRSRLRR